MRQGPNYFVFKTFLMVLLAHVAFLGAGTASAQMSFGDGQGGDGTTGPQRAPEDENQKIREKAGAEDVDGFLTRTRPTTAEGLYSEGVRFLEKGYYTRAQEYLERIRIRFPFSQYATLADLRIGEVYFEKGEYVMAVQAFRDFRKLHPRHAETHYAVYMMASAELEQAPSWASRDQAATIRALEILDGARPPKVKEGSRFEDRFPESPYAPEVAALRLAGRERLADNLYQIGRFYQKRARNSEGDARLAALGAAVQRYDDIQYLYPSTSTVISAQAMQVICLVELGEMDRAHEVMATVVQSAPEDRRVRRAQKYLEKNGSFESELSADSVATGKEEQSE